MFLKFIFNENIRKLSRKLVTQTFLCQKVTFMTSSTTSLISSIADILGQGDGMN